jgi:hypothetical protein
VPGEAMQQQPASLKNDKTGRGEANEPRPTSVPDTSFPAVLAQDTTWVADRHAMNSPHSAGAHEARQSMSWLGEATGNQAINHAHVPGGTHEAPADGVKGERTHDTTPCSYAKQQSWGGRHTLIAGQGHSNHNQNLLHTGAGASRGMVARGRRPHLHVQPVRLQETAHGPW